MEGTTRPRLCSPRCGPSAANATPPSALSSTLHSIDPSVLPHPHLLHLSGDGGSGGSGSGDGLATAATTVVGVLAVGAVVGVSIALFLYISQ